MDLNIKIIEGVQQFPALHDNYGDLEERNHAWMQLAEKMEMHVQDLQIRWHALLQLYQKDGNFKYSNRMKFIHRNKERPKKSDNWPEFVITDEYLKGYNNEDQEQFIYLETEEENNTPSLTSSKENDCNYAEVSEDKHLKNGDDGSAAEKVSKTDNRSREQSPSQDNSVKINSPRKSNEADNSTNTVIRGKEESVAVDMNKSSNTSAEESKGKSSAKLSQSIGDRCEDVIFGELVSAMLKRMDETKKNNIKKEIMNILFS